MFNSINNLYQEIYVIYSVILEKDRDDIFMFADSKRYNLNKKAFLTFIFRVTDVLVHHF